VVAAARGQTREPVAVGPEGQGLYPAVVADQLGQARFDGIRIPHLQYTGLAGRGDEAAIRAGPRGQPEHDGVALGIVIAGGQTGHHGPEFGIHAVGVTVISQLSGLSLVV
jgi:hypothetical protein